MRYVAMVSWWAEMLWGIKWCCTNLVSWPCYPDARVKGENEMPKVIHWLPHTSYSTPVPTPTYTHIHTLRETVAAIGSWETYTTIWMISSKVYAHPFILGWPWRLVPGLGCLNDILLSSNELELCHLQRIIWNLNHHTGWNKPDI